MRLIYLVSIAALGLSACGGSQPTYDVLNSNADRIFDALIAEDPTTVSRATDAFQGGASYTGVAYGTLQGTGNGQIVGFVSSTQVDVALNNSAVEVSGTMNNFVTEDEQNLAGSLSIDGEMNPGTSQGSPSLILDGTLSGSLESPFTGSNVNIAATIGGLPFGDDAEYIGGRMFDQDGNLLIDGSWVAER
ncbi:MAG: hypothetical protein ACJAWC_000684 [Yoonia sp.]|jgi:hypothetical protein